MLQHEIEKRFYRIVPCRHRSPLSYNEASMIPQDLLDILVCPVCKRPVILLANSKGLKCGQCHLIYPIQDDIPIMLVESATVDAS
jgi:uncharacterized protein YbaR (Trm112 family)